MNIWDDFAAVFGAAESKCHWFWTEGGHTLDNHRVLTDFQKKEKTKHGRPKTWGQFQPLFELCNPSERTHWEIWPEHETTQPADCTNESTAVIPQTRDLRRSLVIKPDLSRDANMEDLQRRQLTPSCLPTMRKKQIRIWVKSCKRLWKYATPSFSLAIPWDRKYQTCLIFEMQETLIWSGAATHYLLDTPWRVVV